MMVEVAAHEERDHWTMVLHSSLPVGTKKIQSIWLFKRKSFLDGLLNKHKDKICAYGGMQLWGDKYWETYYPVVNIVDGNTF